MSGNARLLARYIAFSSKRNRFTLVYEFLIALLVCRSDGDGGYQIAMISPARLQVAQERLEGKFYTMPTNNPKRELQILCVAAALSTENFSLRAIPLATDYMTNALDGRLSN